MNLFCDVISIIESINVSSWVVFHAQFREAERKRKEKERVENFQALLQAEEEEALVANDEEFECPVCLTPIEPGEGVRLRGCLHQFCKLVTSFCSFPPPPSPPLTLPPSLTCPSLTHLSSPPSHCTGSVWPSQSWLVLMLKSSAHLLTMTISVMSRCLRGR